MVESKQDVINLNYNDDDPGSVQFGNFVNYYKFHSPDERINCIPKNIMEKDQPFVVLDIGCNSGDLTQALYEFIIKHVTENCYVFAIDIDPVLIERAAANNNNKRITYRCLNFMEDAERSEEIKKYLSSLDAIKFNVTFCFSVTMWIHLNYGDCGLYKFLKQIYFLSKLIVIEPQPWKCYRTAVKRLKRHNREFVHYKTLKIRSNVEEKIETMLLKLNGVHKIAQTQTLEWKRLILFFKIIE